MPSLTTVTLDKKYAFQHKKTVHNKSRAPSSPSFLDIAPALQRYLFFSPSFTHHLITCSSATHSIQYQLHPTAIPLPPSLQTNHINPSFLPFHPLLIQSPPPTPSNPSPLPQTPHCTSTHTQNTNKRERGTTHTPSPPSHFLPILDVGPCNHSYHTLEVHFRTMEMFKTAVYSVECLKEKPIASPVVGTGIHHITHRM